MNKRLLTLSLFLMISTAFAQGTVNFINLSTTLVSAGAAGQQVAISGSPGSYYFGLLIAPAGTLDPIQFRFAGLYATNVGDAFPGRLRGDLGVPVEGWLPGVTMSFLVAGWSSSLGHDWDQQRLNGSFGASGFFGLSSIGTGFPGGPSGGVPVAALNLFQPTGGSGITTGWNLAPVSPVPEPSAAAIIATGAVALMLKHHRKKS